MVGETPNNVLCKKNRTINKHPPMAITSDSFVHGSGAGFWKGSRSPNATDKQPINAKPPNSVILAKSPLNSRCVRNHKVAPAINGCRSQRRKFDGTTSAAAMTNPTNINGKTNSLRDAGGHHTAINGTRDFPAIINARATKTTAQ